MDTLCKIRDMYRAIAEFEARFEKVYQLGLNEGMVLCCLSRMEKLSSGEIAEQLNLTNSNTSKVIKLFSDIPGGIGYQFVFQHQTTPKGRKISPTYHQTQNQREQTR